MKIFYYKIHTETKVILYIAHGYILHFKSLTYYSIRGQICVLLSSYFIFASLKLSWHEFSRAHPSEKEDGQFYKYIFWGGKVNKQNMT